jgi:excisionase family DNA binding protein
MSSTVSLPARDREAGDRKSERVRTKPAPLRLALTPMEAAASIGVSRDFFDEHVLPELRVVRRGRLVLIPLVELERWLERNAARTLELDR